MNPFDEIPESWIPDMIRLGIKPGDEFFFLLRVLNESGVNLETATKIFNAAIAEAGNIGDLFLLKLAEKILVAGKSAAQEIHNVYYGSAEKKGIKADFLIITDERLKKFEEKIVVMRQIEADTFRRSWLAWSGSVAVVGLVVGVVLSVFGHQYLSVIASMFIGK